MRRAPTAAPEDEAGISPPPARPSRSWLTGAACPGASGAPGRRQQRRQEDAEEDDRPPERRRGAAHGGGGGGGEGRLRGARPAEGARSRGRRFYVRARAAIGHRGYRPPRPPPAPPPRGLRRAAPGGPGRDTGVAGLGRGSCGPGPGTLGTHRPPRAEGHGGTPVPRPASSRRAGVVVRASRENRARSTCGGRGKAATALNAGALPENSGLRAPPSPPASTLSAVKEPLEHNKESENRGRGRKTARPEDKAPATAWERSSIHQAKRGDRPSRGDGPRDTGICGLLATRSGETAAGLPCWLVSRPAAGGGMSVHPPPRLVCTPSTSMACGCCALILSSLPIKPRCVRPEPRKLLQ